MPRKRRNFLDGLMSFEYMEALQAKISGQAPRTQADIDALVRGRASEFGENDANPSCQVFDFETGRMARNLSKRSPKFGPYLYVFATKTHFKIGVTSDPHARLVTVQNGNPEKVRLINYWRAAHPTATEASLHSDLSRFRREGEWFASAGLVFAASLISAYVASGHLTAPNIDQLDRRRRGRESEPAAVGHVFPRHYQRPRWELCDGVSEKGDNRP